MSAAMPSSRVPSKPRNQKRCLRPGPLSLPEPPHKKTIDDFVILEGVRSRNSHYGQVKLAR